MTGPDEQPRWWIDGHLDLAYLAIRGRDLTSDIVDPTSACISLPELRHANVRIAFATVYVDIGVRSEPWGYVSSDDVDGAERAAVRQIELYHDLEGRGELSIVRSTRNLDQESALPKIVILMEGCDPIRSPEHVSEWFERGVRIFGLTWACGSRYAGGNAKHGPLTNAGRELVSAVDAIGGVHDISHLSDPAVHELFEIAQGHIVATHSNCRALMAGENQRHVTDEMIQMIAARNGVVGLNLFTKFLADDRRATIDDCVRHLEHVREIAEDRQVIALGSDADGGFGPDQLPIALDAPGKYTNLAQTLTSHGWPLAPIEQLQHGNWMRLLRAALPPS